MGNERRQDLSIALLDGVRSLIVFCHMRFIIIALTLLAAVTGNLLFEYRKSFSRYSAV